MVTYLASIYEKGLCVHLYIVINLSAAAENVLPLGTMVYMGSIAASYVLSPLNLQGVAIVFLMENGKFSVADRNHIEAYMQSLKFTVGSCNAKLLKASWNCDITDILSTVVLFGVYSINFPWCSKGRFENSGSLEAMLFGHNHDNYDDPFRCTLNWKYQKGKKWKEISQDGVIRD